MIFKAMWVGGCNCQCFIAELSISFFHLADGQTERMENLKKIRAGLIIKFKCMFIILQSWNESILFNIMLQRKTCIYLHVLPLSFYGISIYIYNSLSISCMPQVGRKSLTVNTAYAYYLIDN